MTTQEFKARQSAMEESDNRAAGVIVAGGSIAIALVWVLAILRMLP